MGDDSGALLSTVRSDRRYASAHRVGRPGGRHRSHSDRLEYRAYRQPGIAFYSWGTDNNNYVRQQIAFGLRIPLTGRVDLGALQMNATERRAIEAGLLDGTTSVWPYDYRIDTAANQDFVAKFKAKYGVDPIQHSFYSYEATLMLADAMRRAGSVAPDAIRSALKAIKFQSALGFPLQFDDHHQSDSVGVITEIKAGKSVVISVFKS